MLYIPQRSNRRVDLLFINNNHFELLVLNGYEGNMPENGIYPLKTSWSHILQVFLIKKYR